MCKSAQNDACAAQTHPTPDLTLTLTVVTPTQPPTQPFGGVEVCSRGRQGQYYVFRANVKTLHVCAIKRLVVFVTLSEKAMPAMDECRG